MYYIEIIENKWGILVLIRKNSLYTGFIFGVKRKVLYAHADRDYLSKRRRANVIEIIYFLSGEDVVVSNGKEYVNTADTIRLAPPINKYDKESYAVANKNGELIGIHYFAPHPFVTETEVIDASQSNKLREYFISIYNVWQAQESDYFYRASELLYKILAEITAIQDKEAKPLSEIERKIKDSGEYISEHCFEKDFYAGNLPKMSGVAQTYYNRVFKRQFGVTPVEYITGLKMKKALDLLIDNRYSIAEISDRLGYDNPEYFSRVFKKTYGVVPSKYLLYFTSGF